MARPLWGARSRWRRVPWKPAPPLPPAGPTRADRSPDPSPREPPAARRPPGAESAWSALTSYGLVAVLAVAVLMASGTASAPRVVPVTAPVASGQPSGWARWLSRLTVGQQTGRDWLDAGLPLLSWADGQLPSPWPVHWRGLAADGVAALTGTPLNNLNRLLSSAIPPVGALPVAAGPAVRLPPALRTTAPGLPGDHGRIWAQLGARPLVGIYQSHSHEAFLPTLPAGTTLAYSTDWPHTVVQVGWWLAQDLSLRGIPVVQSRVDNMQHGLLASYTMALGTAKTLMRWWPTVKVLLDVHRGQAPAPATTLTVGGEPTARILLVVGTSQLLPSPHWHENLAFALALSRELGHLAPGIVRSPGVETVPYRYNQQLLPADVQVEIGGPHNTLAEERRAVVELADALAALIRAGSVPGMASPAVG